MALTNNHTEDINAPPDAAISLQSSLRGAICDNLWSYHPYHPHSKSCMIKILGTSLILKLSTIR